MGAFQRNALYEVEKVEALLQTLVGVSACAVCKCVRSCIGLLLCRLNVVNKRVQRQNTPSKFLWKAFQIRIWHNKANVILIHFIKLVF